MDLERNYVGLGTKPAMIVVDMMKAFTRPECVLGVDCPDVLAANRQLLDIFREKNLPVIFTAVIYREAKQASVFRRRIPALNLLQPDSEWVEVEPALAKKDNEFLIEKNWASAFFGTDLAQLLRQQNVDSLVVSGLTTSGCVRATVVDGMQYEFPVVVASETVGDRNIDAHRASLHDMNAKYADVISLAELVAYLSRL